VDRGAEPRRLRERRCLRPTDEQVLGGQRRLCERVGPVLGPHGLSAQQRVRHTGDVADGDDPVLSLHMQRVVTCHAVEDG
jgi:hypothetical protein